MHMFGQYAAKEHQQALDILDMEEPINKRLFEKYLKDESGLKDSTTDWEMSQSSVSGIIFKKYFCRKKKLKSESDFTAL